jgi:TnpA family transposase|tara:strand:+ start:337 stop:510 length:174 start_codon:yes stop_codon:yes gene_type:complete
MTDKVDSAIYIFDYRTEKVKTIRLQTFLNRVNSWQQAYSFFALKDEAKKHRKEYLKD